MRYVPIFFLAIAGAGLLTVTEDQSLIVKIPVFVLGVLVAFTVLFVTSTARALKANNGKLTFTDVDDSELDEEVLAAIAQLEELGFQRSDRVLRPIASNYQKNAVVVLMFNEDETVVVEVGRVCGPLMAAYWSVLDVGAEKDVELWTLKARIYNDAGSEDLWQSFPDIDLAARNTEHTRSLELVVAQGARPRPMNVDACITALEAAFVHNRERLLPSLTWNLIKMYGRVLRHRSDYEGRIEEQKAGQAVIRRISSTSANPAKA